MSVLQKRPEIIVFAGPNGSGKSTFTELLKPPIDYINADEIKKNLKCSDLEAAQLAEDIWALVGLKDMEKRSLN
ncbi:MAG: hypothetical protein K2K90_04475 [Lachnospiraceae bacterium]|nr:hypothetical protein [Lachnospiraceae bacterium]